MSGMTLDKLCDMWKNDLTKIASGSEEARLAVQVIPGSERTTETRMPDYPGGITSPAAPAGTNVQAGSNGMAGQLTAQDPAAPILEPDDGPGEDNEERSYVDGDPDLDNQDLMKEANSINALANRITSSFLNKQATPQNPANRDIRAKSAQGTQGMQLTPEVLEKLASIVAATKTGSDMANRQNVGSYLQNLVMRKQAQDQYNRQLAEIYNHGQNMAAYDQGVKMAEAVRNDPLFKLGQEMALEEMAAADDVDAGGDDITVGDVADELQAAVESGDIPAEEAEAILEAVVEDALGSAEAYDEEEEVTPEEVVSVVEEMVQTGELEPEAAAEIVAAIVEGGESDLGGGEELMM